MNPAEEFHKLERWWDELVMETIEELKKTHKEKYERYQELEKQVRVPDRDI